MILFGRVVYLFLSFVVLDEVMSMKTYTSYGNKVLSWNHGRSFYEDLRALDERDSDCLERASKLLGAKGARREGKLSDYAIARRIDVLIGGISWKDEEKNVIEDVVLRKVTSLEDIVLSFIKNAAEPQNMVQAEVERAFVHLRKHDIVNSHVVFNIADREVNKSFFFLLLPSSTELQNNMDDFLKNLCDYLSIRFSSGNLSARTDDFGRSCIQVKYEISSLFDQPFCVSGIPIYSLGGFQFIPVSGGYAAKSIVLRFTIQKLGSVKRLYLMTLFPSEDDSDLFLSDNQLIALSILNGGDTHSLLQPKPMLCRSMMGFLDIAPKLVRLSQSPVNYFCVDANLSHNYSDAAIQTEQEIAAVPDCWTYVSYCE